ncbi:MAG TPA: NADH-quinone oxidoreductase subunit J [Nitrospiraceae bacterium]|nr:NADH-quinone oxidoreductase subunit J [Nitrospiraceae bacterium]
MEFAFYLTAAVAVLATLRVITHTQGVHALLYLTVSFLAIALIFFMLGAPFIGALEVIIYAGAIMVLFVFVIMMLNLGPQSVEQERRWLQTELWMGPAILSLILLSELIYLLTISGESAPIMMTPINPKQVGISLYGPYLIGVELASLLLLPGLIGAYHLGRRLRKDRW